MGKSVNYSELYGKIYEQWSMEIKREDITLFVEEIYKECLKIYSYQKPVPSALQDSDIQSITERLTESFIKNFTYIIEDLMKVRKRKIINYALSLQEIKKENLLEHEKRFCDNLIATIKGYKNLNALNMSDAGIFPKEVPSTLKIEPQEEIQIAPLKTGAGVQPQINPVFKKEVDYVNIRFIKDCSALVGSDLIFYGPFRKEDICSLPVDNARILIEDNTVEQIEVQ